MYTVVLAVHVVLAVTLVGLVLLQQGKGADLEAVMGGGANTLFGVGGASSLLVRMTTGIAVSFMLTSVLLVKLASTNPGATRTSPDAMSGSVLEGAPVASPAGGESGQPPANGSASEGAQQAQPVPVAPIGAQPPAAAPVPAAANKVEVEGAAAPEAK
jgi:preprotein translocase subunit SecG